MHHPLHGIVVTLGILLAACRGSGPSPLPADPRAILAAHVSHGIGASPFDSPLVYEPVAAEMIVRAGQCERADRLQTLHPDPEEGARLVERLQADGLLVARGDRLCTTFPLLLDETQRRYARITADIAEEVAQILGDDLAALAGQLEERGWAEWQYHFTWSQLFDSQFAWTEMMDRGLVPPLGQLIAWVVYPDHALRSGTNYYPDTELRDYWLMVSWRAGGPNTVPLVGRSWDSVYRAGLEPETLDAEDRARLQELDLLGEAGRLHVPVLREGDPLLDLLQSASGRYIGWLEGRVPIDELVELAGVDRQRAFAMAYHDISWGVVERLIRSGRIGVPPGLERGGAGGIQPSMRGVAALAPVHPPFVEWIRLAIESQP